MTRALVYALVFTGGVLAGVLIMVAALGWWL
jgi:hypothetical protein